MRTYALWCSYCFARLDGKVFESLSRPAMAGSSRSLKNLHIGYRFSVCPSGYGQMREKSKKRALWHECQRLMYCPQPGVAGLFFFFSS